MEESHGTGVDNDADVIAWGRARHFKNVRKERFSLQTASVMDPGSHQSPPDAVLALNHSFNAFHTEAELAQYFNLVFKSFGSRDQGLFMIDAYGGESAHAVGETIRTVDAATCCGVTRYLRCVDAYDEESRRCQWHIDFVFEDGSRLKAFEYDWRVWTVDTLCGMLKGAGFTSHRVRYTTTGSTGSKQTTDTATKAVSPALVLPASKCNMQQEPVTLEMLMSWTWLVYLDARVVECGVLKFEDNTMILCALDPLEEIILNTTLYHPPKQHHSTQPSSTQQPSTHQQPSTTQQPSPQPSTTHQPSQHIPSPHQPSPHQPSAYQPSLPSTAVSSVVSPCLVPVAVAHEMKLLNTTVSLETLSTTTTPHATITNPTPVLVTTPPPPTINTIPLLLPTTPPSFNPILLTPVIPATSLPPPTRTTTTTCLRAGIVTPVQPILLPMPPAQHNGSKVYIRIEANDGKFVVQHPQGYFTSVVNGADWKLDVNHHDEWRNSTNRTNTNRCDITNDDNVCGGSDDTNDDNNDENKNNTNNSSNSSNNTNDDDDDDDNSSSNNNTNGICSVSAFVNSVTTESILIEDVIVRIGFDLLPTILKSNHETNDTRHDNFPNFYAYIIACV
eukprot:m.97439 g.97439  ORF g.97439 m.97439 type:complete len:615 (-) comp26978_c0_seq1:27-1871(-)